MSKLRKMLGSISSPTIQSLMALIETQSITTLAAWSVTYVEDHVAAIYQESYPNETRVQEVITSAREYLGGTVKLKDMKSQIKEVNQLAKAAEENPAAQAAARAIAAACSVVYLPTGALGFTFYAAAAIVYHKAGLKEELEVYDGLGEEALIHMLESLKKAAIPHETNPVKIKWNC